METQFDLIIVGAGPAGTAAAVYAGRKKINTLLITSDFGGQSVVSDNIQNWIGDVSIPGQVLADKFKKHIESYQGENLKVASSLKVKNILAMSHDGPRYFQVHLSGNYGDSSVITSKTVLVATGSERRKLPAKNADIFEHKGLTYCASCDGLFFASKDVAVVGAGNAAFESALQLAAYCSSVKILVRGDSFRADEITIASVEKNLKIEIIKNVEVCEVVGDKTVTGVVLKSTRTGELTDLKLSGVFVEVGQIPSTDFAKSVCKVDDFGRIEIDPWTQKTSTDGVWAAGDCTNIRYHQNNIAAGNGVTALEDIYQYLQTI